MKGRNKTYPIPWFPISNHMRCFFIIIFLCSVCFLLALFLMSFALFLFGWSLPFMLEASPKCILLSIYKWRALESHWKLCLTGWDVLINRRFGLRLLSVSISFPTEAYSVSWWEENGTKTYTWLLVVLEPSSAGAMSFHLIPSYPRSSPLPPTSSHLDFTCLESFWFNSSTESTPSLLLGWGGVT